MLTYAFENGIVEAANSISAHHRLMDKSNEQRTNSRRAIEVQKRTIKST
jgi:hypothetical protein